MMNTTFLVIGGGIAGVSCAETLSYLCPTKSIILLTQSPLIKAVTNLVPLGKCITKFDVEEIEPSAFSSKNSVQVLNNKVNFINTSLKNVICASGLKINYEFVCICTGARPKLIPQAEGHDRVITIRDTESVSEFQKLLKEARRIVITGNGGIATELAYEVKGIEIVWVIKDKHISATFVDPGAAQFFQSKLIRKESDDKNNVIVKRMRYCEDGKSCNAGAALGPDWHNLYDLSASNSIPSSVTVYYETEILQITDMKDNDWPCVIALSNNRTIECDLIVSATGVTPDTSIDWDIKPEFENDKGIYVNEFMETSLPYVYAAGDICYANWKHSDHWFQMKLWSQARQMGSMAAKSMVAKLNQETIMPDFCFELFSHVTKLFGYKVVLLGKYNGQSLGNNCEAIVRITPEVEYIKIILSNGKLQGAVLIGETGLEETFENLILNQLDISIYGEDILNPNIDVEDYFD